MDYTIRIPIGSLTIKSALARHTGVRRVFASRQSDHVITFGQSQSLLCNCSAKSGNQYWHLSYPALQVYMGCALAICFRSTPQHSLILGPLSRVHFGESLVNRLYSEIDHTYLTIEAQCVSHHYPRWTATPTLNGFHGLIVILFDL